MSRIENGGTYMTIDTLVALCAALGKKADWLLFGDGTDEVAALAKMDAVKKCCDCGKTKNKKHFYQSVGRVSAYCKPCQKQMGMERRMRKKIHTGNFCSKEMEANRKVG